jgi:class 3 adenylate cyclase/tetratricopeptide (TPR) repeat protein
VRCPRCGEENSDRARFCSSCGAALEVVSGDTVEERKVVSVLFVDLVGFTARSDRADPEDVRSTLRLYHERLKREIERFGGTVEKFVGDAVMAVFGAPIAHEDDAERAVRAALRIGEAIEELNDERPGLDLAIRAAVNTGEAVVTLGARPESGEGFVTGDVVNVASRLQGVAPVGGVVVGELTRRATGDQIEYEELEPVSVKGKDQLLPIWRARGARSRFGVDVEQRTLAPLIGREHELSLLRELYARAVRDETAQLVTVVGEPGVGKSRLVWEFQRFIDDLPDLVIWRQGRCLPYGEGITFWALGEVVKSHAGIHENDGPVEARVKLERVVASAVEDGEERDWVRARLEPLVGLGEHAESTDREESFAAWRTFLEGIASANPFVLVIEDLHWADPAMLAFVEHLAEWVSGVPFFVVGTARPELYELHAGWGGGTRNHTAVSLTPLTSEETAQLIAALLDRTILPAETQAALLTRAGGNPLYAEEFVRMLIDRGSLVRAGGSWDLVAADDDILVPETVQALIAARIDTLPSTRKSLLQDAAVVGKVFWAGALGAMAGIEAREVRDGLHELVRKELVRPARRPSIEGESEFAFRHALIRDVAYGQIPRASRAAKHVAVAGWIEGVAGERVADSAELLAHHCEQALQLVRATGGDDPELEARTRRFLVLAAERAVRLDLAKAAEYVDRALRLSKPGDRDRLRILLVGGRMSIGGIRENASSELLQQAREEARAAGNAEAEAEALAWLSRFVWMRGDNARQFELLEEATRVLEGRPPGPELAGVFSRQVAAYGLTGLSEETLVRAERAEPLIRELGSETDLAVMLQMRGQAKVDTGDVVGGIADAREGLRIAIDAAPAPFAVAAHVNVGDHLWFTEGPVEGERLYQAGIELSERRGATRPGDWARMQMQWTRYDLGRWDDVLEIGDRVLRGDPEGRDALRDQLSVLAEIYRRDVLLHRGVDLPDEKDVVEEILLPRARDIADGQVVVPVFRVGALRRLGRGDGGGGRELVEEADELMRNRPGFRSWLLDWASRVCLFVGAAELLRALIELGVEHMTRDVNSMTSARAALAEAEGDHAAALERYDDAAARWGAFPSVLEHGLALAGAGRCLLALGRPAEAAERLESARARYSALGASPLLAETDALLARAIAKSS